MKILSKIINIILFISNLLSFLSFINYSYVLYNTKNWNITTAEITFIGTFTNSSRIDIYGTYTDNLGNTHEDTPLYSDTMFYNKIEEVEKLSGKHIKILYNEDGSIKNYEKLIIRLFIFTNIFAITAILSYTLRLMKNKNSNFHILQD